MKTVVDIIGVPFALGGSDTGPARGPDVLLREGLSVHLGRCGHPTTYTNVRDACATPEIFTAEPVHSGRVCSGKAVHLMSKLVGAYTFKSLRLGHIPVIIGGDHSVSIGTLPQILDPALSGGRRVGILWLDAHYDAHTPKTTRSHFANGLPLASALGYSDKNMAVYSRGTAGRRRKRLKFSPHNILHIGAGTSDCENEEIELLQRLQVKCITMEEIRSGCLGDWVDTLKCFLGAVDEVIVTLDLDAIRKDFAPGVSFPSNHGLLPSQMSLIAGCIAESKKLRQLEIMEYNPDHEQWDKDNFPITAMLVLNLAEAFLA